MRQSQTIPCHYFIGISLLGAFLFSSLKPTRADEFSPEQIEFFEKKIRPLLASQCFTCHSTTTNSQGGLRIDDRNALLEGGGSGPAIVPGSPSESLLIQVVEHQKGVAAMPPKKHLDDEQIQDLKRWIEQGAAWPSPVAPTELESTPTDYSDLLQSHWAWQPIKAPLVPEVDDPNLRDELDRFIRQFLGERNLKPNPEASRHDWLRRVSFDLTGLPPSETEVQRYLSDNAPGADERLVDRLISSHAYAEKWGRIWLDVARYGESTGSSRNLPYPHAWRYRDYVIHSFAKDKPFDQFIKEQIAGDLLPFDSSEQREEYLTATDFLAIGVRDVNQRYKVRFIMDNVDEQIDAVSRGFLAITASCARCHDHKFDPIPTKEYYALAGIFTSTETCTGLRNKMGGGGLAYYDTDMLITSGDLPAISQKHLEEIASAKQKLEAAQKLFQSLRNDPSGDEKLADGRLRRAAARQEMNKAQQELIEISDPAKSSKIILGVREGKEIGDTQLRYRGEAEQLGPKVPRGFLSLAQFPNQPQVPDDQSGRLQLAQWIASEDNPLTRRVIVNRVWQNLFGRGLVSTTDNFGVNGDRPTHPELLDYLSTRFAANRWSIKSIVKSIVLSSTYRASSENNPDNRAIDPDNQYLWRYPPRRLTAEEIRDTMLFTSGELDSEPPKGSFAMNLKVVELPNNGPIARDIKAKAKESRNRSVYLPLLRGLTPLELDLFDFAEQGTVTGKRSITTVPSQSLYLLNDSFVRKRALHFARTLIAMEAEFSDRDKVNRAFQTIFGRTANETEVESALAYLDEIQSIHSLLEQSSQKETLATYKITPPGDTALTTSPDPLSNEIPISSVDPKSSPSVISKSQPVEAQESAGISTGNTAFPFSMKFTLEFRFGHGSTQPSGGSEKENGKTDSNRDDGGRRQTESASNTDAVPINLSPLDTQSGPPNAGKGVGEKKKVKKIPAPINPDQIVQEEPPLLEEMVRGVNSREAAWMSFIQALYASAEFRHVK